MVKPSRCTMLLSVLTTFVMVVSMLPIVTASHYRVSYLLPADTFAPNVKVNDDSGSEIQMRPALAVTPDGSRIYLFWRDYRHGYGSMYFANSTDGGISFNRNVKVNDGPVGGGTLRCPEIALDDRGTIYLTWGDARNGRANANWIYFSKSTDEGASFTPNVKVNDDNTLLEHRHTGVAVKPDGSEIYVVWYDLRDGDDDIYFSKSTDGGATFSPNLRLNDDNTTETQADPCIRYDPVRNALYVVFSDSRAHIRSDIYFTSSFDGGKSWSRNVRVSDNPDHTASIRPYLATDRRTGAIYAVWIDNRDGDYDVYFARSRTGGKTFEPSIKVNDEPTTSNEEPANIAVDSDGRIYVLWGDYRSGKHEVYLAISNDEGSSFSKNIRVTDRSSAIRPSGFPKVAVDGRGNIYAAWDDARNGNDDIYFATTTSTPVLNATCTLIPSMLYSGEKGELRVTAFNRSQALSGVRVRILENSSLFFFQSGITDTNGIFKTEILTPQPGRYHVTVRLLYQNLIHDKKFVLVCVGKELDTTGSEGIALLLFITAFAVIAAILLQRTRRQIEKRRRR